MLIKGLKMVLKKKSVKAQKKYVTNGDLLENQTEILKELENIKESMIKLEKKVSVKEPKKGFPWF
jgi:hypothetical protein